MKTAGNQTRAILVGCGGISRVWLEAAAAIPDLEIVGFADINPDAATERRDEFAPGAAVAGDLAGLLKQTTADVVFNCTIPEAHFEVSRAALRAGCHVLVEKPLASSLAEARELCAIATAEGRVLAVTQNRRYNSAARHVRELIEAGRIGTVTELAADFYIGAHFGGFRDVMPHVLLLDMAIHHFDLARFLSGENALGVFCREWNPIGSWYARDACAHATFELTGGVAFGYRGSWCAEGHQTDWNADWRIVGTRGSIRWDGRENGGVVVETVRRTEGFQSKLDRVEEEVPNRPDGQGHASVLREFIANVRGGGIPETVGTDNLRTLEMVFSAIASAESGERVASSGD